MKKQWGTPELMELNINETAHKWLGVFWDGGYIGDGQISGHGTFDPNESPCFQPCDPKPNRNNPTEPKS